LYILIFSFSAATEKTEGSGPNIMLLNIKFEGWVRFVFCFGNLLVFCLLTLFVHKILMVVVAYILVWRSSTGGQLLRSSSWKFLSFLLLCFVFGFSVLLLLSLVVCRGYSCGSPVQAAHSHIVGLNFAASPATRNMPGFRERKWCI
jgi:hypothetical protein